VLPKWRVLIRSVSNCKRREGITKNMHFILLATDYDGTLARDGEVDDETLDALERLQTSGRKLLLVTGRHLPDLSKVFSRLDLFDRVIVENGGVLYNPRTREERLLCDPVDPRLVAALKKRNVPFDVGRTVIATSRPYDTVVLDAIRDLGLDLQIIFNKESVMVLPSGVDKGTALEWVVDELGISPHHVVSVGDAENDLSFLRISGISAAVANALPSVKEQADIVLANAQGEGVTDLIDRLIANDLADVKRSLRRRSMLANSKSDRLQRAMSQQSTGIHPEDGAGTSPLIVREPPDE
jgi:phosphoglycolate phosphatase (TIGR01487 family)